MLASRRFTPEDQLKFSALTGDFNPIHTESLAARRTQAGAPVVHGVHALLWLFDILAAHHPDLPVIASVKARFARMIYVGDEAEAIVTHRDSSALRAEVRVEGAACLYLGVTFGAFSPALAELPGGEAMRPAKIPLDLPLEDMAGRFGTLDFSGTPEKMEKIFVHAARLLSPGRLAALGCSTLLVGMVIPGLHSLYAGLTLVFCEDNDPEPVLAFKVVTVDARFRLVKLKIRGGGLSGTLETFVRRPPIAQMTFESMARFISPGEFSGVTALVIGGSRGLGELSAKIIAAGGGDVTISYAVGKAEAEAVTAEIAAGGGRCRTISFDACQPAEPQLSVLEKTPTHIYYFATPAIFRGRPQVFSQKLFNQFNEFYVEGFRRLVDACLRMRPEGIYVFYPSSLAVEERPPGMEEYAAAKEAGEVLCADLTRQNLDIKIMVSRLPRLLTDQTASLQQPETEDAVSIMLPLIRDSTRP